jgi:Ca2+-transporting ATPase
LSVAFTALVVFEMVGIQAIRKIYGTQLFSNRWLWVAIGASIILQLAVLYTPISGAFQVSPLTALDWTEIGFSLAVFFVLVAGLVKLEDRLFSDGGR